MYTPLYVQLSNGYTEGVSALPLEGTFEQYLLTHRTARRRASRAKRLGYSFRAVRRHEFEPDVFAVNTSKAERQGRPMAEGYRVIQRFGPEPLVCTEHHVYTYGVLLDDTLYAYLWLYRSGDLALISSILGHAAHLGNDVMYLLVTRVIERQLALGGTLVYNLHSSGTDGLRYFKERLGFQPTEVTWKV